MSDLWRLTATDLAARIQSKQVSATEAAKDALARLDADGDEGDGNGDNVGDGDGDVGGG